MERLWWRKPFTELVHRGAWGRLMQCVPVFLLKALEVEGWVSLWPFTKSSIEGWVSLWPFTESTRRVLNGIFQLLCLWGWGLDSLVTRVLTAEMESVFKPGNFLLEVTTLWGGNYSMLVYSLLGIFNLSLDHLKTRNKEKSKRGTTVVIYFFFPKTLKEYNLIGANCFS